jgi:hypothetical protein
VKAKTNELETNSHNINIKELNRAINNFKNGYHLRNNTVKDEKSDLVADFHSILVRWRNDFCQLSNVHGNDDVRQSEIHTAEPPVPQPSAFEAEMAKEKLKRH